MPDSGVDVRCPFQVPESLDQRTSREWRAISRYILYPALVKLWARPGLVHILDHSSVHLIPYLPKRSRVVVTVHDIAPLEMGEDLTPTQLDRFTRMMNLLRRAEHLICDSEYTAQSVKRKLGIPREQMTVVLLGVHLPDADFSQNLPADIVQAVAACGDDLKLLVVGNASARKNLAILPAVIREVRRRGRGLSLLRVGQPLPPALREEIADSLGPGRFVEYRSVDDRSLGALYTLADVYCIPSVFEGFGFPILEAMAHGCPVVSSSATSLPEVGGDHALYFDPADAGEAAERIVTFDRDPALRERFVAAGLQRAAQLSWRRTLDEVKDVYAGLG